MRPFPTPDLGAILVTGASSGLGTQIAFELARQRYPLILTGRNRDRLAEVGQQTRSLGSPTVFPIEADLSLPEGTEDLLGQCRRLDTNIVGLVNNAGAGRAGPWNESSENSDRRQIELLINAPLSLTRAFVGDWEARGCGAVLNISSSGAFQPGPETSVYYAAKAFLMSWSVALREEEPWLSVTTLCPGAMATEFSRRAGKSDVPGAADPKK